TVAGSHRYGCSGSGAAHQPGGACLHEPERSGHDHTVGDYLMNKADRLYQLLPAVYRMTDVEQGESLRALLQVIAEQVNIVESDISRLYENWFIETCDDWV